MMDEVEVLREEMNAIQGERQFSDIGMGDPYWAARDKYNQALHKEKDVVKVIEEVVKVEEVKEEPIKSLDEQLAELKANGIIS